MVDSLDAIRNRLDVMDIPQEVNGQMAFTSDQAAKLLGLNDRRQIDDLRKHQNLRGILVGKKFIYPRKELERFLTEYLGADLSNGVSKDIEAARRRKR